jgi:hypothetical protein
LNQDAHLVFPRGHQSILGIVSAGGLIDIVEIAAVGIGSFSTRLLKSFNLATIPGKVRFLETLVRFLRYVATIDGPNQSFHLVPGVRRKTPNGHHITWIREGLLKEYGRLQSPQQMEMIQIVYEAKLPHVEHGVVPNVESKSCPHHNSWSQAQRLYSGWNSDKSSGDSTHHFGNSRVTCTKFRLL